MFMNYSLLWTNEDPLSDKQTISEPYDSRAIANVILDISTATNRPVTHSALHKIVYFCHAWYLASFGRPLVSDPAEAWTHGPVYRPLYAAFKGSGRKPISSKAQRFDYFEGKYFEIVPDLTEDQTKFIEAIAAYYMRYSGSALRALTHVEGGPWHQIWEKGKCEAVPGMRIPNDLIHKFYSSKEARPMLSN